MKCCTEEVDVYVRDRVRCIYSEEQGMIAMTYWLHHYAPVQEQDMAKMHTCPHTLPPCLNKKGRVSFSSVLDLTTSFNKWDIAN